MTSDDGPGFVNFRAQATALDAAERLNLQPVACRFLLATIAGYTNGHPAFPSYERLASRTGLGVDAVRRYAKTLVDAGYLAKTRRANPKGGWGQPEWGLGPTCQVGAGSHSPQVEVAPRSHLTPEQVGAGSQSSGNGLPLASGNRLPQKREVVGSGRGVVLDNDRGETVVPVKRTVEETDPPTPQPVKANGTRVGAYIAHLTNAGHADVAKALTPADKKYIADQDFDPDDFAACMVATIDGTWSGADKWIKARLSVRMLHQHRYQQWVTRGGTVTPAAIGGAAGDMLRWIGQSSHREERPRGQGAIRRPLPPPAPGL